MTEKIVIKPSELPAGQIPIHWKGVGSALKKERNVDNVSSSPNGEAAPDKTSTRKVSGENTLAKTARLELVFLCSSCGKKLSAPITAEGTHAPCPDCGNRLTVPNIDPALDEKVSCDTPNTKKPSTFKFFCIRCGQSLETDRGASGANVQCPHCHSAIDVPQPSDEWI